MRSLSFITMYSLGSCSCLYTLLGGIWCLLLDCLCTQVSEACLIRFGHLPDSCCQPSSQPARLCWHTLSLCNYCIFNFCVESFKIIVRTLCDNSGLQQQGFWPAFLAFSALVTANGQKHSTSGLDLILGRALIMSGCSTNCKLVR